jgi:gluconokinase
LKGSYRQELFVSGDVKFVYLKGSYELISRRLRERHGHFATEKILADQFATLEEPEDAVTVDVDQSPEEIVREIREKLGLR